MPIWIDEIADTAAWRSEFLKPEAKEVVQAVGAWVYCFKAPLNGGISAEIEETMKAIYEVSEEHVGFGADLMMLAVAMPRTTARSNQEDDKQDEMEDTCLNYRFEYIDYNATGKNEYGEKTGFERLKEALQANEWPARNLDDDNCAIDDLDLYDEDDTEGLAKDEVEMTAELFGMKAALAGNDLEPDGEDVVPPSQQATQVEDLDMLMGRLLAVREQSADLPEAQRKRMAAKAVKELMAETSNVP